MKKIYLLLGLCLMATHAVLAADDVQFSASAPNTVIMDQPFQLTYTVNSLHAKDLRIPEITDFDILAGPFESTSSSMTVINGKSTSNVSKTYTYTLMAKKEGTFTIPSASITVNREKYTTNGLKIKVLPPDQTQTQQGQPQGQSQERSTASATSISNENIFIRTQVSKTNVYEQECILLTYKLYTLVDVTQFTNNTKLPDFNGFLQQSIEQSSTQQLDYEHYNGRNYGTVVLHQVLLYPQHTGVIEIDPANFEAVIRVQNRSQVRSIFDDFFASYTNVTKMLVAPGVKINVKALPPGKPAGYTGAVGRFNIDSDISKTTVKTNEAVALTLTISGTGNMKLLKTPDVDFPADFELYDPKVVNNFKNTTSGVTGTKTIEYLAIPRSAGSFVIPPVEFSYFDTQDKTYKTLKTPAYSLNVEKGESDETSTVVGTYVSKEDVKQISTDIRYIATQPVVLKPEPILLFGSWKFWSCYLLPLVAAILMFVFFRKQIKENADVARMKNKKANKVARKRLKVAQKYWKENRKELFYDEILKALWIYLSDKLSIPMANLNKANVCDELAAHKVPQEYIDAFIDVLNTCEFARYAPVSGEDPMGELYAKVVKVISNLEEYLK